MHTYKISYLDGTEETISAARYYDVDGQWIDFTDGPGTQLLRVMASLVARIEVVKA